MEGAVPINTFPVAEGGSTIDINGTFNNIGVMSGTGYDLDSGSAPQAHSLV